MSAVMRTGAIRSFIGLMALAVAFYYAHWNEYYSGTLILGKWDGPTEAQAAAILLLVLTGVVTSIPGGEDFWITPRIVGLNFGDFIVIGFCFGALYSCQNHIRIIGKLLNWNRQHMTYAFLQLLGLTVLLVFGSFWVLYLATDLFLLHPRTVLLGMGFIFAYLTSRLIVQRICKEPIRVFYIVLLPLVLMVVNSTMKRVLHSTVYIDETLLMWVFFTVSAGMFWYLCYMLIRQLTRHLKIKAFTIPYPPPAPAPVINVATHSETKENITVAAKKVH